MTVCRTLGACVLIAGNLPAAPEWNDPTMIQINAEPPHATFRAYPNAALAREADPLGTPWVKSLNGDWKFHWALAPDQRPASFYEPGFDDSKWPTIPVPSNWQLEGYGTPIYRNAGLIFPQRFPDVSADWNPVGSYRRHLTIPDDWDGRRTFLRFEGVDSAFYVWVNGRRVGYSQGSGTPAEFDVTPYLQDGENLLAVEVYRFSDGSYLEDQDFWRLSGIFRDVTLVSTGAQRVRDLTVVTEFDEDFQDAELQVEVEIEQPDGLIEATLLSPAGEELGRTTAPASARTKLRLAVEQPLPWTAETPDLHLLLITLRDEAGRTLEVIPQRVGFREVEIRGEAFLVNGRPVWLKGVNRHEHDPQTGHSVSRDAMIRDLERFKRNNINAVRTSHYPNDPAWYELCDQFGIYVVDEANLETHWAGNSLENVVANDPAWTEAMVDRQRRMVERDKNHPSVVIWSLGNEAGDGPNFRACIDWIHRADPTRPVHYEGSGLRPEMTHSDFGSMMYAPPVMTGHPGKPFLLCEYSHAMGNSNGNLQEYLESFESSPRHHGGFIWDWQDQGLRQPVPAGYVDPFGRDSVLAYGRFWANYRDDARDAKRAEKRGEFCMNGLLAADGTPHPGLKAVKHIYQAVQTEWKDADLGLIRITNRFDFLNLKEVVTGRWSLRSGGLVVASGEIRPVDLAPGETVDLELDLPANRVDSSLDQSVWVEWIQAKSSPSVPAGHVLAQDELPLSRPLQTPEQDLAPPALVKSEDSSSLRLEGEGFAMTIDKASGRISSYLYGGIERLRTGPQIDFWRPLTDNDRGWVRPKRVNPAFRTAAETATVRALTFDPASATVTVASDLADGLGEITMNYTVRADGGIRIVVAYTAGHDVQAHVLRWGTRFTVPREFDRVTWHGRGPDPTYVDRAFEPVGVYHGSVDDQWIDYSHPQENGNKVEVRWMALRDPAGEGVLIKGADLLSTSCRPFDPVAMEGADYTFKLQRLDGVSVNADLAQTGVGGNNSWGALPLPPYVLAAESFAYSYSLIPISAEISDLPGWADTVRP